MSSKLEINVRSFITHCEEMAKNDNKDWRLIKYIKSLDIMIQELEEEQSMYPTGKAIQEYRDRCVELKKMTNYVEPQVSNVLRGQGDGVIREAKQIHNAKYYSGLRKDLLGDNITDGLRKRDAGSKSTDIGGAMSSFANVQEKLAEEMISLTRSLKEQTQTANKLIKNDVQIVSKSSKLADNNFMMLNKESGKLTEHSKRACKCWVWMMIGCVMLIFMFMVLFIKIVKK
ncbi:Vesicle transport protein USE1 [Sergentomyia squamirostris]